MAQYHFDMPDGWVGARLPPPYDGVHMRPSVPHGNRTRAAIVLLSPIPSQGTLSETLGHMVREGSLGAQVVRQAEPVPFRSIAFPGLLTAVRLRTSGGAVAAGPVSALSAVAAAAAESAPRLGEARSALPSEGGGASAEPLSDEGRIFAVLDAGAERIPVVFAGGPEALPLHKDALDQVLTSLRPHLGGDESPFSGWTV